MISNQIIMFISIAVSLIFGVICASILIFRHVDAILVVNTTNPEKDSYNFVVLCPLDDLRKRKRLIIEVKKAYLPDSDKLSR